MFSFMFCFFMLLFSMIPFSLCCGSSSYWVVGVDNGNIGFLLLILILFPLVYWIAGVESNTMNHISLLFVNFILLLYCFVLAFLLLFFVVYECFMIVLFFMLYLFVPSFYRIRTAFIFYFFTIFGSISFIASLLLFIACNWWVSCTLIFIPFLIKVPSFPFFYWLPEVHCESNSAISLLLAGLLLKLGVFGIVRFILVSFYFSLRFLSSFILSLSVIGIFLASCSSFRYFDTKKIIAFSSIIHLNLSLGSIVCMNGLSVLCGILTSIAHAMSSSGLFLFAGLLINKTYSRYLDSLFFVDQFTRFSFFILCLANLSFALSFNFVGEIYALIGLFSIDSLWFVLFLFNLFLATYFWFLVLNMKITNYLWNYFLNYIELFGLYYLILINYCPGISFLLRAWD